MTVIPEDSTGYGDKEPSPHKPTKFWKLVRRRGTATSEVVAHLECDDEIIGLLYLDSEEDFEWLSNRLGIQRLGKS